MFPSFNLTLDEGRKIQNCFIRISAISLHVRNLFVVCNVLQGVSSISPSALSSNIRMGLQQSHVFLFFSIHLFRDIRVTYNRYLKWLPLI